MTDLDKDALDRHITGNYGEDQIKDAQWLKCPDCEHEFEDEGDNECPECGWVPRSEEFIKCDPPSEDDHYTDADRKEEGYAD